MKTVNIKPEDVAKISTLASGPMNISTSERLSDLVVDDLIRVDFDVLQSKLKLKDLIGKRS